ncbi:SMAD/FHA domain-containing protein [Coprinopsis marcescibilis]|uniref:SMAD/FHA domain-containing protein n=1 Tax=Coprinopsis marcescibilis TaxID=230819 RepID=A0A5C3KIT8_COPMA|nr:SMAD/FHA domain-containing protein [Coprinopsis marcescibilis]
MEAPIADEQPSRTTILGSFLRGRPRNSSQSHIHVNPDNHRELSPSPPQPPSPNPLTGRRRNNIVPGLMQQPTSHSNSGTGGLGFSNMLRRRRSAGNVAAPTPAPPVPIPVANSTTAPAATPSNVSGPSSRPATAPNDSNAPSHRIRLVPHIDNRRNLRFDAITRDIKEGDPALRIGRFTDRSGLGLAAVNALNSNKLAFKSKVVSRAHAEIWCEGGGKFLIKDTRSSSGTFLNHIRLSPANTESKPHPIKDGDILQLGVDYQGGTEDIYKSVKIRIELGREWQATANAFNTNAIKALKALAVPLAQAGKAGPGGKHIKTQLGDCCICLFPVTIRQALFITPCSHTFHYKCLRPLLESHHPGFACPLCRTFADLEEDVEVDPQEMDLDLDDSPVGSELGDEKGEDSGVDMNGNELQLPTRETGAETEVEGEGSSNLRVRRAPGIVTNRSSAVGTSSPFEDGAVAEAMDQDINDRDMSPDLPGGPGREIDAELGLSLMEDVDGTVGGKRKR